jgi:hypothetical protein
MPFQIHCQSDLVIKCCLPRKVGKFWSARIGVNHRALAVDDGEDFIWVWIGTHDEYERMIKELG